jgi:hypothetical protein
VVGKEISSLPEWTQNWSRLGLITQRDYTTLNGRDINKLPAWAVPQVKSGALVITDANGNGKIDLAGATFSETEVDGKKIGVSANCRAQRSPRPALTVFSSSVS